MFLPEYVPYSPLVTRLTITFLGLQQKQAEEEEEFIVNKLMKRLDQLKREKQVLANEVCLNTLLDMGKPAGSAFNVAFDMCLICRLSKKKSI